VVLGLVLAPSGAGLCLALAALAGFLARHPLRLWFLDRRKRVRYPRTAMADFRGYAGLMLLLAAGAALARASFWPALAAIRPVGLLPRLDAGRSREALPEPRARSPGRLGDGDRVVGGLPRRASRGRWASWRCGR
jgi:hypothetical protein